MDLTQTVAPTLTSIDATLVAKGKRIRSSSESDLIEFWIKAADAYIEKRTNLALMEQTLQLRLRRILPFVLLPRTAAADVQSVKFTPDGGAEATIADTAYTQTVDRMLTRLDFGLVEQPGTMTIVYKAGADEPEKVPAPLRQASYLLAASWVSSREATYQEPRIMQVEKKISSGVDELTKEFRVPNGTDLNGGW
jgi:uncharacterized phiE125 gp8 family phage protein